jgi:hypothetical protein
MDTGELVLEQYFQYGRLHREDGPCSVGRLTDRPEFEETLWMYDGSLDHPWEPARTIKHVPSGVLVLEEHYRGGVRHREGRPALIQRNWETGEVVNQEFYLKGEFQKPPEGFTYEQA